VALERGLVGHSKMQSAFAAARLLGASTPAAWALQGLVSTGAGCIVAWLWASGVEARLQRAGLLFAAYVATPFALDYDLVLLGPALAWFALYGMERGFLRWEMLALSACWALPFVARLSAMHVRMPITCLVVAGTLGLIARRVAAGSGGKALSPGPPVEQARA
jgi:hypothetical protein